MIAEQVGQQLHLLIIVCMLFIIDLYFVIIASLSEYIMRGLLAKNTGSAILQSPKVTFDSQMCFQFEYNITSEKVQLHLDLATSGNFQRLQTWGYENQTDKTSWSVAQTTFAPGVTLVQLVAEKFGFTSDVEYVSLRETKLYKGSCKEKGELFEKIRNCVHWVLVKMLSVGFRYKWYFIMAILTYVSGTCSSIKFRPIYTSLLGIQHGTRPILCSEVLIHYNLDPTIISTLANTIWYWI